MKILTTRLQMSYSYLVALDNNLQRDWNELYEMHLQGDMSLVDSMTLIHPDFYKHAGYSNRIRGNRKFPKEHGMTGIHCSANAIWGYACPLKSFESIVADHLFPYSLGGPTNSDNKLYLCRLHNELKGNDIHMYPWERGEPRWLDGLLLRISRLLYQQ